MCLLERKATTASTPMTARRASQRISGWRSVRDLCGVGRGEKGRVEAFRAERRRAAERLRVEEAGEVVDGRGESGIAVEEGDGRLGAGGHGETDLALAHLQRGGGERERTVIAVLDGDLHLGVGFGVGAEGGGNAEGLLADLLARLG